MAENVVLKVLFDTSEAVSSAKNLDKVMQTTSKATDDLNVSLNTTQKELSEFDKNVKGGADGLKNLAQAKKQFNDISIASSTKEVKELANELQNVLMKDKEFMKVAGEVAKAVEKGAITDAQAFEILEDAINKGVNSVKELSNRTEDMTKKTMSFKQEMRQLTELINSGKLKGDELVTARQRLADMKDQASDLAEQTKILGSDTKLLSTTMAGLSLGVGIFASLQGATAIFGTENEKLQQTLVKVNGAMALLQGLEQVQNTLKKDSIFLTGAQSLATSAYGVALRVVTAIQTAFGVSSATAWAIATGGITLLITAIGLLIYNYKEVTKYVNVLLGTYKELNEEEKRNLQIKKDVSEIQKDSIQNGGKEIANVIALGIAIKDQNLPMKDRLIALSEYNKIADESNKISIEQINNTDLVTSAINRQYDAILKIALATAAKNKVDSLIASTLEDRLRVEELQKKIGGNTITDAEIKKTISNFNTIQNGLALVISFEQKVSTQRGKELLALSLISKNNEALANELISKKTNIKETEEEAKRIIELYGLIPKIEKDISGGGIKTKTLKVKPEKIEVVNPKSYDALIDLDGFTKEIEFLQETLKEIDLSVPLRLEDVNIDDVLGYTERLKSAFLSATGSIGGDFSGVTSGLGGLTTSLFDLNATKKAIQEQRLVVEFAYKQLESTKIDFNNKMKEANKQLADAEKDGNEERIREAKKTADKLKQEYDKSVQDQESNIGKQESTLLSLEDGLKKASGQIAKYVGDIFLGFTQIISNSIDRNIANLDKLIEKQKVNVAEAKQIADKGNSQLYDAELKKEAKLEELRREQARKKKAIAIAEILINNAVGIANIWAQWGSQAPAGPIIAGVLTGLLAALTAVQIGVVASQQFRKGGKVPTGMMKGASHEQGGIKFGVQGRNELYEMEGDEFIFNRETSLKNQKWFDKINNEKIDLDNLLASVRLDSMQLNPILSTTFVNQNGQLEDRLKQVEKAIIDLPNRMPQASFNADSRGLSFRMKQIIDKENAWKR
jgi:hypothetical protein